MTVNRVGICPGSGVFKTHAVNVPFPRAFSRRKYRFTGSFSSKISNFHVSQFFKVQVHDHIFFAKDACPAIVYADIVVVIDPFFVGVCPWIKVYRYNPTEICQRRLQGVRNVAQKLCSWDRIFLCNNSDQTCFSNALTFARSIGKS